MSSTPQVINRAQARELLAQVDVPQILRKLFRDLAAGLAVQPAQQLVEFPQGAAAWPVARCGFRPARCRFRRSRSSATSDTRHLSGCGGSSS